MGKRRLALLVAGCWLAVMARGVASAAPRDDSYISGYVTAVLERQFKEPVRSVEVSAGVVTVTTATLRQDREQIVGALSSVPGVVRVQLVEEQGAAPPEVLPSPPAARRTTRHGSNLPVGIFPGGVLFGPLLADPRWPNFSAGYQGYMGDRDFRDVAAVSFGETFAFYRGNVPAGGQWETGLQASVFAIFDLDTASHDLINADYFVGIPLSYRQGPFSAIARAFHQSSHLGDEFLLRTRVNRVNLSYESVDAKLSYQWIGDVIRVYGGAGFLFDQDPSTLKPWSTQVGMELRSPWSAFDGAVRPVAAADVQARQENGWDPDVSLRAGLEFESVQVANRKLALLFEYFNGHSPHGQFYRGKIDYFGVAVHLYY